MRISQEELSLDLLRRFVGAFDEFSEEWFFQIDHGLDDRLRKIRGNSLLEKYFGGPDGVGLLGEDLERVTGRALTRFRESVPDVKPREEALFCYMAVRMDNEQIGRLLHLEKGGTVSVRKNRLAAKIRKLARPQRDEFLDLIGRLKKR